MRYSLVLATLAASAIATPYINVEVSEPGDVQVDNRNRHHGVNRRHRDHNDRHQRGWLSSLFGGNDEEDTEDRRRRRRDNDRRGRNGRRNRDRNGRRGRNDDEDDDERFHSDNIIDDLFSNDYECVIFARDHQDEKEVARKCCREVDGELYNVRGRCIVEDNMENPRDEWRTCALEHKGAHFAECYYREQREVDDELDNGRDRNHESRRRDRDDRRGRDGRHGPDDRNRRHGGHRNDDQVVLGRNDRRQEQYECRLNVDDQNKQREITRICCQEDDRGELRQNGQKCQVRGEDDVDGFENCAINNDVPEEEIQCRPDNRNNRDL